MRSLKIPTTFVLFYSLFTFQPLNNNNMERLSKKQHVFPKESQQYHKQNQNNLITDNEAAILLIEVVRAIWQEAQAKERSFLIRFDDALPLVQESIGKNVTSNFPQSPIVPKRQRYYEQRDAIFVHPHSKRITLPRIVQDSLRLISPVVSSEVSLLEGSESRQLSSTHHGEDDPNYIDNSPPRFVCNNDGAINGKRKGGTFCQIEDCTYLNIPKLVCTDNFRHPPYTSCHSEDIIPDKHFIKGNDRLHLT